MTGEPELSEQIGTAELERRLERERPVPGAAFRGSLRRRLAAEHPVRRPGRLRAWIGAYAVSGSLLLAIATIGVAGAGPLAP